jgi:hypothetical protein
VLAANVPTGYNDRSGWALGTSSTGVMAGGLVGPLVGGALPSLIGVRVAGPLVGGFVGGYLGMRAVFLAMSALLLVGAGCN